MVTPTWLNFCNGAESVHQTVTKNELQLLSASLKKHTDSYTSFYRNPSLQCLPPSYLTSVLKSFKPWNLKSSSLKSAGTFSTLSSLISSQNWSFEMHVLPLLGHSESHFHPYPPAPHSPNFVSKTILKPCWQAPCFHWSWGTSGEGKTLLSNNNTSYFIAPVIRTGVPNFPGRLLLVL